MPSGAKFLHFILSARAIRAVKSFPDAMACRGRWAPPGDSRPQSLIRNAGDGPDLVRRLAPHAAGLRARTLNWHRGCQALKQPAQRELS